MEFFSNSLQHLLAELERVDLLIRAQVAQIRKLQTEDEQFRGLYISEQEVDALLQRPLGKPQWLWSQDGTAATELTAALDRLDRRNASRKEEGLRRGVELRLDLLQQIYRIDRFELDALLACLAVELDIRYERLYAYLQDDVTKKKPSIDLILNLLSPTIESKLEARQHFSSSAPLIESRLVEVHEDPSQPRPPLIAKYLKLDGRIAEYLLGSDELDDRIRQYVEKIEPLSELDGLIVGPSIQRGLRSLAKLTEHGRTSVVHLRGPYGVGKRSAAEAVCQQAGLQLLVADMEALLAAGDGTLSSVVPLILREARLQHAAVYCKGFDALLDEQHRAPLAAFLGSLKSAPPIVFLAGEAHWEPHDRLREHEFVTVELPRPTSVERAQIWHAALSDRKHDASPLDLSGLSSKFKLTNGQIWDAAATGERLAAWRDSEAPCITARDLYDACRMQSNQKLTALARKITPRYGWTDIVLPDDRLSLLREICNHVKYRDRVYGEWGFERKLSLGKGLAVLFAGPSGTGKTMAADIIAGELGLELYKIDLSSVVSKYIGETEKNLSRIFTEAETSNAILFFDEADALFGKRSEVKDAHDRYANIETGYLLQRMEEYDGVAILATNLQKNMDEAFVRRLHFTVDFPFPGQEDRLRIWTTIWPQEMPREPAVDLQFMAQRFEIAGGNIRNIVLAAAFLAVDDGGSVHMDHLIRATQREYQKMGKLMADGEFVMAVRS